MNRKTPKCVSRPDWGSEAVVITIMRWGRRRCIPWRVVARSFSGKLSPVKPNSRRPGRRGDQPPAAADQRGAAAAGEPKPREVGGREGPEPTRFGDWELRGRCIDF